MTHCPLGLSPLTNDHEWSDSIPALSSVNPNHTMLSVPARLVKNPYGSFRRYSFSDCSLPSLALNATPLFSLSALCLPSHFPQSATSMYPHCPSKPSSCPSMTILCYLTAPSIPPHLLLSVSSLPPHCLLTASSLHLRCLLTASSLHFHCLLIASSLPTHFLLSASSLPPHCTLTDPLSAISLPLHCLLTASTLPPHCLLTSFSLRSHCPPFSS